MQTILQALATLAALLVPLATIIALVQSRGLLTLLVALTVVILFAAGAWFLHMRRRVAATSLEIEGISIDCMNAANLRRRVNRTLMVQTAEHTATIDGGDLEMMWRYGGYCRASSETAMEFSIDSTNPVRFDELNCHAFDLCDDPGKKHPIRPLLIGPNGISKKIAVPFSRPLSAHNPFDLVLCCRMPGTYMPGTCYYTSTLSFDQPRISRCAVTLRFLRAQPSWVRVYTIDNSGRPKLLKSLHPVGDNPEAREYRDVAENVPASSARIYIFRLDAI